MNDGCTEYCEVVFGWDCTGGQSGVTKDTCTFTCGNGVKNTYENCDDGNTVAADGCTNCSIDSGYKCTLDGSSKSICTKTCGDGVKAGSEACDDGNTSNGDG